VHVALAQPVPQQAAVNTRHIQRQHLQSIGQASVLRRFLLLPSEVQTAKGVIMLLVFSRQHD
jgi:hypothetical protein